MAVRIVQAMWRFDAESLISLRSVMDRIIKQKQVSEKSFADTVSSAGQLQLSYRHGRDRRVEVDVESTVLDDHSEPDSNGARQHGA